MPRIPAYEQGQLASSLVGTAGADTSTASVFETAASGFGQVAQQAVYYQAAQQREQYRLQKEAAAAAKAKPKAAPTGSLKRKLQEVEARMAELNTEGASLEAHLCKSPPPAEIAELGKRLSTVNDELQKLEETWLTLSSELEGQPG